MSTAKRQAIEDLIARARSETRQFIKQGAAHFRIASPQVEILFNLRGKTAGQARFPRERNSHPQIRYNLQLLADNGEQFLQRTVPHESAHVIAYQVYGTGIRPHGDEWRRIMALFGADASRCHSFETRHTTARRVKRYAYHCACQNHALSSIRHNRALSGQTYLCRACGAPLQPGHHPDMDAQQTNP
jgi:SprT protein